MVLNSKVYIPKLTEQREILNVLKSGDVNLMDPLFDSLRTLFKIYNADLTMYNPDKTMKAFVDEVKFFYSYKTKNFVAKIFIADENYIFDLHYESEINYKTSFIFKNKNHYANVGKDILLLEKRDTSKLHKIFFDKKISKEDKKQEVLNFLTDKVANYVLKETSKIDVETKKIEREFKKLFKSGNISVDHVRSDNHWNDFLIKMFKKEIDLDIHSGCSYPFFDKPEPLNYYKIGMYSSLINEKEFTNIIFKDRVLFPKFSKKQDCYLSGYDPLLDLTGLLLLSTTITSLSNKEKLELISELIPEKDVVFDSDDGEASLQYMIGDFFSDNNHKLIFDGSATFISEANKLLKYLINTNPDKAKTFVKLVEKILETNYLLEDFLVIGSPELLADFFLLKDKIKQKNRSRNLIYEYTIIRCSFLTADVISKLKDTFNAKGIKVGFVFNKSFADTFSDYNDLVYLSKISEKIGQPIGVKFCEESNNQIVHRNVDMLSTNINILAPVLNLEPNHQLSFDFKIFNRCKPIKLKNEIKIILDNEAQLLSILYSLNGFCGFDLGELQLRGIFEINKRKKENCDKTGYFSLIEG